MIPATAITDIVTALTALNQTLALGSKLAGIVTGMQAEGRKELNAEEKADLQAFDDAARAALQEGIERAKAEGR
jgi:hypothetical protein